MQGWQSNPAAGAAASRFLAGIMRERFFLPAGNAILSILRTALFFLQDRFMASRRKYVKKKG